MKNLMSATAILALLAMTSTTALAQGPIGNCGNQEGSGTNPNGGGNTCGGSNDDDGTDTGWDSSDGWSGSTFAGFQGGIFSENIAAAEGDHTFAATGNMKFEEGFASVVQTTEGPGVGIAGATVFTQGVGAAGALSAGHGSSVASSGVLGQMQGFVSATVGQE